MVQIISKNRKAWHEYFVEERLEAGIVLTGTEVKSCRDGRVNFKDAYCDFRNGELYVVQMHISPYPHAGPHFNHEPERPRKLLMHRRELKRLLGKIKEKGFTLVPLALYLKGPRIKLEIGLVRGKKLHDKRESIKQRDADRNLRAAIKEQARSQ